MARLVRTAAIGWRDIDRELAGANQGFEMSSRSRNRHTPWSQATRLFRRHRPMIITLFTATVAVLVAVFVFTRIRGG
jgi:hypothetical protein